VKPSVTERLQRTLLPDRLPEFPGLQVAAAYLPGDSPAGAGGDWYDVVALADGAVGIAIGDVVGRGGPAAELGGRVRNEVRTRWFEGHSPGEVLRHVNRLVDVARHEMSTVLLCEYSPATHALCGANAGHPPAFIRRADGRIKPFDFARSVPLGVDAAARYDDASIELRPGDAVLFFTDGLVERRAAAPGESLDLLRLAIPSAGSADDMRAHVLDRMLAGEDHDDDVAVVVLAVDSVS
jgi:serine phosphatase RsbU (regulator of sigma subunit)